MVPLSCGRAQLEVKALELLRAGHVRRSRATLRLVARGARHASLDWATFHQAVAMFWEGAFEKARTVAERAVASDIGELRALAVALQVECLLLEHRIGDARGLFDAHATMLTRHAHYEQLVASGTLLEVQLRFHESDRDGAQADLEAILSEDTDESSPLTRLVAFYLAAIHHQQGRASSARRCLSTAIDSGGELFISTWAFDTHGELFPNVPIPSRARGEGRPPRARRRLPSSTLRDLKRGLRILVFRRSALAEVSFTFERVVALMFVNLVGALLLRCVDVTRGAIPNESTAIELAGALSGFTIVAWLSTRGAQKSSLAVDVTGAFYSALPTLLVLDFAALRMFSPSMAHLSGVVLGLWSIALVLWMTLAVARGGATRAAVAVCLFVGCCIGPMYWVHDEQLWYAPSPRSSFEDVQRELLSFVFAQADQVHAAEATLAPQRPGVPDLYFVGFAGWAEQDVFLNEVTAARTLFDERFDTHGRSLILANDPSARAQLPMATQLNLGHVLKAVGDRMNPEEDVLFLFVTSHGSRDAVGLSLGDVPMMFTGRSLSPENLRAQLCGSI